MGSKCASTTASSIHNLTIEHSQNARKLISSASQIFSGDPLRHFTFGLTIEGSYMKLWFFSYSGATTTQHFEWLQVCIICQPHNDLACNLLRPTQIPIIVIQIFIAFASGGLIQASTIIFRTEGKGVHHSDPSILTKIYVISLSTSCRHSKMLLNKSQK